MYKLLDWIAGNRKIAIILAIFLIFLVSIGSLVLLSNSNKSFVIDRSKPFQGSQATYKLNWWVTEVEANNDQALTEIISKFKEKPVVIAAATANGAKAAATLKKLGFTQVSLLQGGFASWRSASLPVEK